MRVFDCFLFFNEIDLLDLRLNILKDKVDKFIIVEQSTTHQGKPKKSIYLENIHKFSWIQEKIIHHICDGEIIHGDCSHQQAMSIENKHRNALSIVKNYATNDDLILISDLDEIPDFSKISITPSVAIHKNYHYNFNTIATAGPGDFVDWRGTIFVKLTDLNEHSPQYWRDNRKILLVSAKGWHFSYFGGSEKIRVKLDSFCHPELHNFKKQDIDAHIVNGTDFLSSWRGASFKIVSSEDAELPKYLLENKEKYKEYFK